MAKTVAELFSSDLPSAAPATGKKISDLSFDNTDQAVSIVKPIPQRAFDPFANHRTDEVVDNDPSLNASEKALLKANKATWGDKWVDAYRVMSGDTEKQKEDNIFTRALAGAEIGATVSGTAAAIVGTPVAGAVAAVAGGVGGAIVGAANDRKNYYFDQTGFPVALAYGEKPPPGAKIESAYGNFLEANDDNALTTLGKSFYNTFLTTGKVIPQTLNILQGLATGSDMKILNDISNTVDSISFETSTKSKESVVSSNAFKGISEIFNDKNWNFNLQNMMAMSGNVLGSVAQFMGGGKLLGAGAEAAAEEVAAKPLTLGQKILKNAPWKYPKAWAVATLVNMGESVDAAKEAGVTGRAAYALNLITGIGMGALELGIGGEELDMIGRKAVAKSAAEEFTRVAAKKGTTEVSAESLEAAWKATFKTGLQQLAERGRSMVKFGMDEAAQESSQEVYTEAMQQLYDKMSGYQGHGEPGSAGFGTHLLDANSLQQIFENGIGGALGGIFGGVFHGEPRAQSQSQIIFDAVKNDKVDELNQQMNIVQQQGRMTDEQRAQADFKVAAYQRYMKETEDLDKKVSPETRRQIFDLSFQDENAQAAIKDLEADIEKNGSTAIKQGKLKAFKQQSTGYISEIAKLLTTEEKPAAEPKEKTGKKEGSQKQPAAKTPEVKITSGKDNSSSDEEPANPEAAAGQTEGTTNNAENHGESKESQDATQAKGERQVVPAPAGESDTGEDNTSSVTFESSTDKLADQNRTESGKQSVTFPKITETDQSRSIRYKYNLSSPEGTKQRTGERSKIYTPEHFKQVYDIAPEHQETMLSGKQLSDIRQYHVYQDQQNKQTGEGTVKTRILFKDGEKGPIVQLPYAEPVNVKKSPSVKITSSKPSDNESEPVPAAEEAAKGKAKNKKQGGKTQDEKQQQQWEDRAISAVDTAKKTFNKHISDMLGGREGKAFSGGPIEIFQGVVNTAFDAGKLVLVGEKNIRKALKVAMDHIAKHASDIWQQLTGEQKQMIRDDMQQQLSKVNEYLTKASMVEASESDILDFEEALDLPSSVLRYGDRMQLKENKRRLRRFLTDEENISVVPGYTVSQLQDTLTQFARSGSIDESDVRKAYEQLPLKPLADHLQSVMDEPDFIWMHNMLNSFKRLKAFHFINNDGKAMTVQLSNSELNRKNLAAELYQQFESNQRTKDLKNTYEKKRTSFIQKSNELFRKVAGTFTSQQDGTTLGTILTQLSSARNGEDSKAVSDLEKQFQSLADKLNLRDRVQQYIDHDIQFFSDVTGFSTDHVKALLDTNHKGFDSYADYMINSMIQQRRRGGHQSTTLLRHWIIDQSPTYQDFVNAITKSKNTAKSYQTQINSIAKAVVDTTTTSGLSEYYDDVMGNTTDSEEMISTLELMADDIGKPEVQNLPRLQNNPWVKLFDGQQLQTARMDGIKNKKTGKQNGLSQLTPVDLQLAMVTAFMDEKQEKVKGKDIYYQFYDPQSDAKGKVLLPSIRYSIADIAHRVETLIPSTQLKKSIADWTDTIQKFIDTGVISNNTAAPELAKQFVYNSVINKYHQDDYFRGDPKNVKSYQDQVKRKISGSGERLNLKVKDGVGESHNVMVINDPEISYDVLKLVNNSEAQPVTDGQHLIMPWFDDAISVSSGGQYSGIVKDIYFKTDEQGKNTMLKGNCVRLDEKLAEKNPTLKALLDYARKHSIDRISFSSTAKLIDKSLINTVSWKGVQLNADSLPESPALYKADNRYMFIQQDLVNDGKFKKADLTTQILHIIKSSTKSGETEKLLALATQDTYQQLYDDIKDMSLEEKKQWFLDNIPNDPSYLGVRQVLSSKETTLDDPAYKGILNSIFGSIVKHQMLGIPSNKLIGIHVQLPGIELKSLRNENGTVRFGEIILPATSRQSTQNNSGVKEGETVIAIRVPSDDWHSFSPHVVTDFFEPSMKNVVMIDGEAQKSAGMDNDADAGHIWAKFKNDSGEVITYDPEGKNGYKALMNRIHQIILNEYKNPDNLDHFRHPIDTTAADAHIKNYQKKGDVDKNLPDSIVSAFDAVRQSNIVIGKTANAIKVRNYLSSAAAALRDEIHFPKFTAEGKATHDTTKLETFTHDQDKQRTVNFNMGNNLNQALDNPKLNKLLFMGKVSAVSDVFDLLSMLNPEIQGDIVHFMNNPTVQDYIKMFDEQRSVIGNTDNVFLQLGKQYNAGRALNQENEQAFRQPWKNNKVPDAADLNATSPNVANRLAVLKYLSYLEYIARDIGNLNAAIRLNDNSVKSYAQYIRAFRALQNIVNGKLNMIGADSAAKLYESFALSRAKNNISILREFYSHDLFSAEAGRQLITTLEDSFGIIKRGLDKEGNVKKFNLTEDQLDLLYRSFYDFASVQSLNITESRKELQEKAKSIYESLPDDNIIRKYLQVNSSGELVLNPTLQRKDTDVLSTRQVQKAFKDLTAEEKLQLMKYHVMQFGYNVSQKFGGFLKYMDVNSQQALMSENIDQVNLFSKDQIGNMIAQVMKNNVDLIPEARLANNAEKGIRDTLRIADQQGEPMTLKSQTSKYPPFVKRIVEGKLWIHPLVKNATIGNHYSRDNAYEYQYGDVAQYKPIIDNTLREEINYHRATDTEERAINNPKRVEFIRSRLKELFPWMKVFTDAAQFQQWMDTHYPNQKLDTTAFGAEIGDAYWINEQEALQSTELHEALHKFWDMIPDNDITKSALRTLFRSEQAAITAIGEAHNIVEGAALDETIITESAKEAFRKANIEFQGTSWQRFKELMRQLWIKIKKAVWPATVTKEQHASILADRFWNNRDDFDAYDFNSELIDYMKRLLPFSDVKKEMEDIEKAIGREGRLHEITQRDVASLVDKNKEKYTLDIPYFIQLITHKNGPVALSVDTVDKRTHSLNMISKDTFSKKMFEHDYKWFTENGDGKTREKNIKMIDDAYTAYQAEVKTLDQIVNDHHDEDSVFDLSKEEYRRIYNELDSMSNLKTLGDASHAIILDRIIELQGYQLLANDIGKWESQVGSTENKIFIKALHEMAFSEDLVDWKGFLKDRFGKGIVSPWMSMRDVKEKPLQALYEIRQRTYNQSNISRATMSSELNEIYDRIKKLGGSLQPLIKQTKNRQHFITPESDEYKKLESATDEKSKLLKEYLDKHFELMRQFTDLLPVDPAFYAVPQAKADWFELLKRYGFRKSPLQALGKTILTKMTDNHFYDAIHVSEKSDSGKYLTLREARSRILTQAKDGLFSQVQAGMKIQKLMREAKAMYDSSSPVDIGQQIIVRGNNESFEDPASFKVTPTSTHNTHAALLAYYHQQIFQHAFIPKLPVIRFLQEYYNNSNTENIGAYVKMMNDWFLYDKTPESGLGKYERWLKFANILSLLQFLGFNLKAGVGNAIAGVTQNMREIGFAASLKGMKRVFEGMKPDSDWKNAFLNGKMINVLKEHKIVNVSRDLEISLGSLLMENANHILYSPVSVTEMFNHGITIGGLYDDAMWEALGDDGKPKPGTDPKLIANSDYISRLINEASRIHGAYDKNSKRPLNSTTEGRSLMLLKNWMPDIFLAHWRPEMIDSTDTTRKGILNTVKESPKMFKSVFLSGGSIKENYNALKQVDKENLGKFMREMMMTTLLLSMAAGLDDDKDTSNLLSKAASEISYIYDMNNYQFLLSAPVPAFKAVYNQIAVLKQIAMPTFYENKTKYMQSGDWKGTMAVINNLPANRLIKEFYSSGNQ